jgi:hypothetical protein
MTLADIELIVVSLGALMRGSSSAAGERSLFAAMSGRSRVDEDVPDTRKSRVCRAFGASPLTDSNRRPPPYHRRAAAVK